MRGIQGQYSLKEELKRLRAMPRVRKGKELKFVDGPQTYSRHYVEPKDGISQMFHLHLEEYAPGGKSQKHGHVNEAAFYILDGVGYEIHDGVRYDWKAGDVAIVHNNCVHQHFNASTDKPARALVIKTKPMFMFMNMLFQQLVEPRPTEPAPGAERHPGARSRAELQPSRNEPMAWDESESLAQGHAEPEALSGAARRRRHRAGAQRASARRSCIRRTCPGRWRARACSSTCSTRA